MDDEAVRCSTSGTGRRFFNYRLSRTRRYVENAFGVMADRWGCLLTTLRQEPQNLEIMVNACITLHGGRRAQMMLDAEVGIRYSPHL